MVQIYESPQKIICQGDIFIPDTQEMSELFPEDIYQTDINIIGFIVSSNTCDIDNENITFINICPIVNLEYMVESIRKLKIKQEKSSEGIKKSINTNIKNLVGYNQKKYFYLHKDNTFPIKDEWVVLIEFVLTYDRDYILPIIEKRRICSLKNPWREKLGWTIGNFYNRVSLLEDHPPEKVKELIKRVKK